MNDPTNAPAGDVPNVPDHSRFYDLCSEAMELFAAREKRDRVWTTVKRVFLGAVALGAVFFYYSLYAPLLGISAGPNGPVVAVVPIQGEIGSGAASADSLVLAIERACKSSQTKAVILRINSPGGSPTDAERIAGALEWCRPSADAGAAAGVARKPKQVIAVIEGVGASAAYLIAIHADEVYSTRYALVGSIGAVMRSFDAGQALEKFGVHERVFASGDLKAGNSPWSPNSAKQDEVAQALVNGIAELFIAEVRERRGSKLKDAPDLFSGRMWVGPDALRLGLIDGNMTFEALHDARFRNVPVHYFRPTQTLQDKLGLSAVAREFGVGLIQGMANTQVQ